MKTFPFACVLGLPALLGACAVQPAYQRPTLKLPADWSDARDGVPSRIERDGWWRLLDDPAVDRLVDAGLLDNPTLAEAAARMDQARAVLSVENAQKVPSVGLEANATYSRDRAGAGSGTTGQTSLSAGARLSWEIDLWGRVRSKSDAAESRLAARTADTEAARLSIVGDIADAAIALRGCHAILNIRGRDIASRETELQIGRARLSLGSIAPFAIAAAEGNFAAARIDHIAQEEGCTRLVNALVALSGVEAGEVRALLTPVPSAAVAASLDEEGMSVAPLPVPPPFSIALPATVLRSHPAVVAAESEAMARWAEVGVAKAERLPRIDLLGVLTGQWIRALGSSSSYVSGSAGAGLTLPIFDGGAGKARVRSAEAAYREAAAQLIGIVRIAIRDIEDGLAARQSAEARIDAATAALTASEYTLRANLARWRAGAIAQFELEETRRQFNAAQENLVAASADRARAWIALVRRAGPAAYQQAAEDGAASMLPTGRSDGNMNQ
ncbi:MAG: OprM [Sphingopyxis macrogoltabida]|uniref:OprM n=1 Tax=Sphingopyxis macrogoltabida TaxID=33050 RepID=A0A2W5L058_SPHMC|nr:MAG: OprM [Sphingopyxis macrogoltabida]